MGEVKSFKRTVRTKLIQAIGGHVQSDREPTPEEIVIAEMVPGSARYLSRLYTHGAHFYFTDGFYIGVNANMALKEINNFIPQI